MQKKLRITHIVFFFSLIIMVCRAEAGCFDCNRVIDESAVLCKHCDKLSNQDIKIIRGIRSSLEEYSQSDLNSSESIQNMIFNFFQRNSLPQLNQLFPSGSISESLLSWRQMEELVRGLTHLVSGVNESDIIEGMRQANVMAYAFLYALDPPSRDNRDKILFQYFLYSFIYITYHHHDDSNVNGVLTKLKELIQVYDNNNSFINTRDDLLASLVNKNIYHFPDSNRDDFIADEIIRRLQNGGYFVCSLPDQNGSKGTVLVYRVNKDDKILYTFLFSSAQRKITLAGNDALRAAIPNIRASLSASYQSLVNGWARWTVDTLVFAMVFMKLRKSAP